MKLGYFISENNVHLRENSCYSVLQVEKVAKYFTLLLQVVSTLGKEIPEGLIIALHFSPFVKLLKKNWNTLTSLDRGIYVNTLLILYLIDTSEP